jgi:hypothetical protein
MTPGKKKSPDGGLGGEIRESLEHVVPKGEPQKKAVVESAMRQSAIIRQFNHANSEGREDFLKRLASGEISDSAIRTWLQNVEADRNVWKEIGKVSDYDRTLAGSIVAEIVSERKMNETTFMKLRAPDFEPASFEEQVRPIFEVRTKDLPEEGRARVWEDILRFERFVYGARVDYWEEFKSFKKEADETYPDLKERRIKDSFEQEHDVEKLLSMLVGELRKQFQEGVKEFGGLSIEDTPKGFRLFPETIESEAMVARIAALTGDSAEKILERNQRQVFREYIGLQKDKARMRESSYMKEVDEKASKELLKKVEIHAEEFNGHSLTREVLEAEGLMPKHRLELGNVTAYFSDPYDLKKGRVAVVGYIAFKGKIVARSYYRSNSQGMWRYLPRYLPDDYSGIRWYDKGHGEESITLPAVIQRGLAEISLPDSPVVKTKDPQLIFAGTARKLYSEKNAGNTYVLEVHQEPLKLAGNFYAPRDEKIAPDDLRFFNPRQSPDFTVPIMSWKQNTSIYGMIEVEAYSSKDGELKYLFCSDAEGRTWIGGIEKESEIQSTGLYTEWINPGDMGTPGFEYGSQTGGYGDPNIKRGDGAYEDMFRNYLRRTPIIQEYLVAKKKRQG